MTQERQIELPSIVKENGNELPTLKQQTKTFRINVNANKTLFCFESPKRVINSLIILCTVLYVIAQTGILPFLIFEILVTSLFFSLAICFLSKCNLYITKQASKSFTFWYKTLHATIAMVSYQIYFNSFIPNPNIDNNSNSLYVDIPPNIGYNNIIYHCVASFGVLNYILSIVIASLFDSILTKSNKIKRFGLIFAALIFAYRWFVIYLYTTFNYSHFVSNVDKSFDIKIFNQTHIYYWRSMALSSIFKSIAFLLAQLYHNFKVSVHLKIKVSQYILHCIVNL